MKKNLRIVSVAAAALLAVAPVAATTVSTVNVAVAIKGNTLATGDINLNLKKDQKLSDANTLSALHNEAIARITNQVAKSIHMDPSQVTIKADWSGLVNNAEKVTYTVSVPHTDWAPGKVTSDGTHQIGNYRWNKKGQIVDASEAQAAGAEAAKFTATVNYKLAKESDASSENIVTDGSGIVNSVFENDPNVSVNINATAETAGNRVVNWASVLNGQLIYTDAKGTSHTALLHGDNNTTVYKVSDFKNGKVVAGTTPQKSMTAGQQYVADFNKVTINLGSSAAGSKVKFVLPRTAWFAKHDKNYNNVQTVPVDSNGVADPGTVYAQFYAYDPTDLQEIHFYSEKTGNQVTSGNINLHAVNGKLGLYSLFHAMNQEYVAAQLDGGKGADYAKQPGYYSDNMLPVAVQNDLRDQLKKQNIEVDPNGNFTAPASFTVNMNAKSIYNGATATLPVTVDNVTPTAANETTKNVTIMHIATIYDKNGKATHEPALRAYNSVSVVSDPVQLKDEKGNDAGRFYKLAGKDQYIKVGNVDGTSRSLKKNSYVYKSTGKAYMKSKKHHRVLKAGSSVTTYGKSFMIAGQQMYRIGRNQYVKKQTSNLVTPVSANK